MKKQVITWTAIPHGPQGPLASGDKLGVSVFVSPRLQESGTPTLGDFPDWLKWPETVAPIGFKVAFAGGPTFDAHVVSARPDMDLWHALFTEMTPIIPFVFEDRTNQIVRSYPVGRLQNDIQQRYRNVIQTVAKTPSQFPGIRVLYESFSPLMNRQTRGATLSQNFTAQLRDRKIKAFRPDEQPGGIAGDYQQVDAFLHRTPAGSFTYTADPATHPARPTKANLVDSFDFHKMISALGGYPELLVKLGLVIELEIPFEASIPMGAAATTVSILPSRFGGAPNVRPNTHYSLDNNSGFRARPQPGSYLTGDLLLALSDGKTFEIMQTDVGGTSVKLLGMAESVLQHVERPIAGQPMNQSVPSLRSAGISLIHTGRAYDLAQRFQTAAQQNAAAESNAPVDLYADDLVRGYAIDIWHKMTGKWLSISRRNGTFTFKHAPASKRVLQTEGEACVTMAGTEETGTPNSDLHVHEQIFRWSGWSLAAPRPVTPIGIDGNTSTPETPTELSDPNLTRYGLTINFKAPPHSLPKLRFGHFYKARARMVDVAGNSIDPTAPGAQLPAVQTNAVYYARWEPVIAPAIALRSSITGSPGESMGRLVIRSDFDRSVEAYYADQSSPTYNEYAERHFLPPKTSEMMAETHGMFDNPPPPQAGGKSWYEVIKDTDVSLPQDTKQVLTHTGPVVAPANPLSSPPPQVIRGATYTPTPLDTDHFPLPYLPDPLGEGASFLGLPGIKPGAAFLAATWGGHWPYYGTFRLLLKGIDEHALPALPKWVTSPHPLLTVELPRGETVTVQYSSRPFAAALALLGMWDWIVLSGLGGALLKAAQEGLVWLLTPFHEMTLVHAVQHPLVKPGFSQRFFAARQPGATSALLVDMPMPISGNSTVKMDLTAQWYEPVDDVTQTGPAVQSHNGHISEIPINYGDTTVAFPAANPAEASDRNKLFTHEFNNTKYHRVSYTAVGTTRYREYFPFTKDELAAKPDLITRSSDTGAISAPTPDHAAAASVVDATHRLPSGVIDVPSSARPQSPNLLYVLPIFSHSAAAVPSGIGTLRLGGGLRVYLERPWYSSGEGELLGVVLPAVHPPLSFVPRQPDPSHITQWGIDPIWRSFNPPTPTSPPLSAFVHAVRTGNNLTIDEQAGVTVAVAGHEVTYDPDRRLWYADVLISGGLAYYPFIRLVLARYQPNSIANAYLSRLVLADFSQIAPDRLATVIFDGKVPQRMTVTVVGQAPLRTTNIIEVSMEQQISRYPEADADVGWVPVQQDPVVLHGATVKNETVWTGAYSLPKLSTPLPPLRLVLREYELYPGSGAAELAATLVQGTAMRLVYAETLDVLLPI